MLFILPISPKVTAQYYSSGSDPASIHWRQIRSPYFKVVYPHDFEHEAQRFITIMDSLYLYGGYTLQHTPKPINILIHSHTAYSNGFVSWAPKRMELYPMAGQDVFAQDYLQQLAIHEFRHVVQIDKLNKGFTKVLSYGFGQQAIGAVLGLYAPLWFLEGDATLTETTLSPSGRGRLPAFEQEIRAQLLEKQRYHYDKAYFGSYKNYVPNHYNMGYLLTAGARYTYGPAVWEQALDKAGRHPYSITPFNNGIRAVIGKNKVPLYNEVFSDWKDRWAEQDDALNFSPLDTITPRDIRYKNHLYPTLLNNQSIVAEVNGPSEIRHLIKVDISTGKTERLVNLGLRNKEPFSVRDGLIAWTELEQHPRWENQHYSVIRLYNTSTGEEKKITKKSNYFAPAISPDGTQLIAIHLNYSNERSLHLLTVNGELLDSIAIPENALPLTPQWHPDGSSLVIVLLNDEGKHLTKLDLFSKTWTPLTSPSFIEIKSPYYIGDEIYFSAAYSGIDNIYRLSRNGILEKVTESRFGADSPHPGPEGTLLYHDYTSDGYIVAKAPIKSTYNTFNVDNESFMWTVVDSIAQQEKGTLNLNDISTQSYVSKPYSKWNLLNFHSWAPAFVNVDETTISPGVSLMSQNLLSTTFVTLGYNGDKQFSREKYVIGLAHRAWLPVIDAEIKWGNERLEENGYFRNDTDTFRIDLNTKQQHLYAKMEVNVPLVLTRGSFQRRLQPAVSVSYQNASTYSYDQTFVTIIDDQVQEKETVTITVPETKITSVNYSISAYNIRNRSLRDLSSRWGQSVELTYRHTPFDGHNAGSIMGLATRLYLPGLAKHHSIRLDNNYQYKMAGDSYNTTSDYAGFYYFPDLYSFPRGTQRSSNTDLYSLKADYMMPLINPDLNIPGVIYLKRISLNLFYDHSWYNLKLKDKNSGLWQTFSNEKHSFGTELRAELHPFRFVFPMTIGHRYAYIPGTKSHYNELLLSLGLSSLTSKD